MMKNILLLGAGRSTVSLVQYLLKNAELYNWFITIGDISQNVADELIGESKYAKSILFDVSKPQQREDEIINSEIVISMLPARWHIFVARDCVRLSKSLVTASYVSEELSKLDKQAKDSGIILLNEIGLDPGIDHMSAMSIIDSIKDQGGEISSFKSFCGGLIHPDYDNNPWNYKFTWNPRNVVLAGQGTAQYIKNGKYKNVPYNKLFERLDLMNILDAGKFEGYANRDSLSYRKSYSMENIPTIYRGTLRKEGFCKSWNLFVQLGMTDDTYIINNSCNMTYREFTNSFLPFDVSKTVEQKFCDYLGVSDRSEEFGKVKWLGMFSDEVINLNNVTPAMVLQLILEKKWALSNGDKDMVVMQHQFEYTLEGENKRINSSLLVYGDDSMNTAMAKTVGLPVGIATKLILNGDIKSKGVVIPTLSEIYTPLLQELKSYNIDFVEELVV
jgi:saccharopine dehydrogenase-like NADP-dependent oxidoreductase